MKEYNRDFHHTSYIIIGNPQVHATQYHYVIVSYSAMKFLCLYWSRGKKEVTTTLLANFRPARAAWAPWQSPGEENSTNICTTRQAEKVDEFYRRKRDPLLILSSALYYINPPLNDTQKLSQWGSWLVLDFYLYPTWAVIAVSTQLSLHSCLNFDSDTCMLSAILPGLDIYAWKF